MTSKLNRCYFQAASAGTGDFVYDETEAGFMSPVTSGSVDGDSFYYIAEVLTGGVPTQWELGVGIWTTDTLTRTAVESSNGGLAVDFTDPPKVRMGVPLAADFNPIVLADGDDGEGFSITAGTGTVNDGGDIDLTTGDGESGGGSLNIRTGEGTSGSGGTINIEAGPGTLGGGVIFLAGQGNSDVGGSVSFEGGQGATDGGGVSFSGGVGAGKGGSTEFSPGAGDEDGGDFKVELPGAGSGRQGLFIVENLPTSDPGVSGALWNDGGVLTVSP